MKYEIEVPEGFLLKGLHHMGQTAKHADMWWAYVQTAKPEYGTYCHFQGGQGFSIQNAVEVAHANLVKSIEARKRSAPTTAVPNLSIKLDLSSILKGLPK